MNCPYKGYRIRIFKFGRCLLTRQSTTRSPISWRNRGFEPGFKPEKYLLSYGCQLDLNNQIIKIVVTTTTHILKGKGIIT
jgi:hypothetical protein